MRDNENIPDYFWRNHRPHRYRRAVYEAGHAVVARVLHYPVSSVSIIPIRSGSEVIWGSASVFPDVAVLTFWLDDPGKLRGERSWRRGHTIIALAGAEAMRCICGVTGSRTSADEMNLRFHLHALAEPEDALRTAERLRRHAARMVRAHLVSIERVGGALMERRTLSEIDIDALIGITP